MKNILIIDGYNVIQRTAEFGKALDDSLEAARTAFIARINSYLAKKRTFDEVIVAFDAARNKTQEARRAKSGNVSVVFSSFGESADDLIKSLIKENSSCRNTIVSDDNYVINNSRALGAAAMSCKAFVDLIGISSTKRCTHEEKGLDYKAVAEINEQLKKQWRIR